MKNSNTILFTIMAFNKVKVYEKVKIEPPFWCSEMKQTELQPMVNGSTIAAYVP